MQTLIRSKISLKMISVILISFMLLTVGIQSVAHAGQPVGYAIGSLICAAVAADGASRSTNQLAKATLWLVSVAGFFSMF
ncbi:hypothetical protein ACFL31_04030 [Candidatus Margulisiibacteriota bacterium]